MSIDALPRTVAVLEGGIADGLHPGAQLYVSLNGRTIADAAVGESRPGVPMTRDSLTLWMSAGKPATAVAILQLVDRGLLTLDTRVADVIPEFGVNGKDAVTLRHVLTHTAGFRGPLNNFTPGSWDEIVARACALRQEPGWVPGHKAGYHVGSSWFVLGELVRRLDGRPIDAFVRDEVFAPLGEPDASIGMTAEAFDARERDVALMWVTEKSPTADWPGNTREANTVPRPGANARGPIRALGRMYEALMKPITSDHAGPERARAGPDRRADEPNPQTALTPRPSPTSTWARGGGLLSGESVRVMGSRHRVAMFDETFKQTLDWGLGVMVDSKRYAGEHAYGFGPHACDDAFGHGGNQSSCAFADPRHGLVVAWACNGMPGEATHQARARAINAAVYEDMGLA